MAISQTLCTTVQAPPSPPPYPSSGSVDLIPPPESVSSSTPPDALSRLVKQLCETPERIALENYRPGLQEEDSSLQEVAEETLAQHNLSQSLKEKGSEEQSRYRSLSLKHTHRQTYLKHTLAVLNAFTSINMALLSFPRHL